MKLLSIGNSFSQDAQEWLHQIAVANGVDLETTNLMIGGCSLETHWSHVVDKQAEYYLEQNGKNMDRMVTIDEGLALDEWDVITVQQASHYSGQPQTYVPYLTDLVAYVRERCPKAKIYFQTNPIECLTTILGVMSSEEIINEVVKNLKKQKRAR